MRPLFATLLLASLLPITARAQTGARATVYAGVGYLSTPDLFDLDGDRYDSGVTFTALTAELGGTYAVYQGYGLDGLVEVALHLARVDLEGEGFEGGVTTGFQPRNVVVIGHLDGEALSARAGVFLDLQDRPTEVPGAFTTDGQHAALLGASAALPFGPADVEVGGTAFLTVARSLDAGGSIDDGDIYEIYGAGTYPLGPLTLGLRLQYVAISDVSRTQDGVDETFPDSDSGHVGLIPSLTIRPSGTGLEVTVQAGARSGSVQEYADYGIALSGKNAPATRAPVAVRVRYGF